MKKQKMLHVVWSEKEEETYYVDKDEHSKAHDLGDVIILKSYSGTYTFDKISSHVVLDTGTEKREVSVINWKVDKTIAPA